MPIFRYRAVAPSGEVSTGEFDGSTESDIVERLREQGLMAMQVAQASDSFIAATSASAAQALDARREVFSRFYVNIVRAGEAGGALGVVLQRLAETMERNKELRDNVRSALIYPTILIGVAVVSVIVLLIFVVPQFQQTFAQAGKALPLPTEIVIFLGTFMRRWWWATLAVVVLGVAWFRRRGKYPLVRRVRDA